MTATETLSASREIACTRIYDAPKELLIRMWANPEHIANWWGPHGFTTTTHAMDFKTDGIWRFTMHGPDGADYPNVVRYTHISPDRIEYVHTASDGTDFTAQIDFAAVDGGTEMSFRMTFPTPEIRRHVVERFGAEEGLKSTVSRLEEYVVGQDPKAIELAIVRQFNAPQERVWEALTDQAQLRQWLGPIGLDVELNAGEPEVGGRWTMVMSNDSGMRFESEGQYIAIEPIHLLKMTQRWKNVDGTFKPTTTITYKLHKHEGKTTMTFVQTGFWSEEAAAAHLCGWDSCLQQFAKLVGATKADRVLHLVRELNAPIDLVWECWTKPERLATWFAPRPYTVPKCEIDFRPGGALYLVMRSPEGVEHPMSSIIVDIEPQSRLSWVSSVPDISGDTAIQSGMTAEFEDLGGRTRVTVHAYAAAYTEQGIGMVGGMEQGWNMTLDQMVEAATSAKQN